MRSFLFMRLLILFYFSFHPVVSINTSPNETIACRHAKGVGYYCRYGNMKCNTRTQKCECFPEGCLHGCPGKRQIDRFGCPSCTCEGCDDHEGLCRNLCHYENKRNSLGCAEVCECNTEETVCQNSFCPESRECDRNTGRCVAKKILIGQKCRYHSQIGYYCASANWKCNLLTQTCECYPEGCPYGCPGERELDDQGCPSCTCQDCGTRQCRMLCRLGFKRTKQGCEEECTCNDQNTVCKNTFCKLPKKCKKKTGKCEMPRKKKKQIRGHPRAPAPTFGGEPSCRYHKQIGHYCTSPNWKCNIDTGKCECSPEGCPHGCPGERELDELGCPSCTCQGCAPSLCRKYCDLGFKRSENGCEEDCVCNDNKTACENTFCKAPKSCKRKTGRCEIPKKKKKKRRKNQRDRRKAKRD